MASFRKRGDLQWQARVSRKGYPPQVKTFSTRAEAEAWAATVESQMARSLFVCSAESERTTLHEALERYLREITPAKKGAVQERSRLRLLASQDLSKRALASIRGADIAAYRDERLGAVSATTVAHELTLLSHLFNIARKEWGMENLGNPVELVRKPKRPNGRDRRLQGDEETRLLAACEHSNANGMPALVVLALETAMRLGELLKLEWRHVDLTRRVAVLPDTKNGDARAVPLSSRAIRTLETLGRHPESPRVFHQWKGSDSIQATWRRICERAQIVDLHFHDLRHEATSRLFERGLNSMEVATVTGHRTLQMLKRYTHLRAEDLAARLDG